MIIDNNPFPIVNLNHFANQNNNLHLNGSNEVTIVFQSNIKKTKFNKNDNSSCLLYNFNNISLTHNYRPLSLNKTIEENGIYNGSIIYFSNPIYNLAFIHQSGKKTVVSLDGDCPLRQAIIFYCKDSNIENIYQSVIEKKVMFLFDAKVLNIFDETPINQIFNNPHPNIFVSVFNNVN